MIKKKQIRLRSNSASINVTIAGVRCTILSSTSTQIRCLTGSYSQSSIISLIQVNVQNFGLALNVKFFA